MPINYEEKSDNNFGKILFPVKKGIYRVDVVFMDTLVRRIGNIISLISFLAGLAGLLYYRLIYR